MSIIDWVEWYNKKDVISDFCLFCIFSQPWNIGHSERRKRAQTESKGGTDQNISSGVEFQRWWVLKSKIFGWESTYSKETFVFYE